MDFGFPLYIQLTGNNCMIFGGGDYAAAKAETLLRFGAKVTVISPGLCDRLRTLDDAGSIRYIPRKYFRGDCTPAVLCVAATNDRSVNIAISVECKAKNIPVHLSDPAAFGNFMVSRDHSPGKPADIGGWDGISGCHAPPYGASGTPLAANGWKRHGWRNKIIKKSTKIRNSQNAFI